MNISISNGKTYVHDLTTQENILIEDEIFNGELFGYAVVEREDVIDNLIMWIGECKTSDKQLMKDDLKYLIGVSNTYIFSSFSTNDYIMKGDTNFIKTCKELVEINKQIKNI